MREERDIQPEKKHMVADKIDKIIEEDKKLVETGDEYVEINEDDKPKDPRIEIAENREKRLRAERGEPEVISEEGKDEEKPVIVDEKEQIAIKVNGREILVDKEKVDKAGGVQAYQKEVAVNQGFQDLAKERKLLEKQQQEFIKQQQEFQQKQNQPPAKGVDSGKKEDNPSSPDDYKSKSVAELIKIEHTALVDGDDEAATAAALELHERRGNTIDQNKVVADTAAAVTQSIEASNRVKILREAQDAFHKAHPDVKEDPRLLDMVDEETNIVMKLNPEMVGDPGKILEKAYQNINHWKGGKSSQDSRLEEKRQLRQPVSSSGRVQSIPEPKQETKSEYVQNLRKMRGLE